MPVRVLLVDDERAFVRGLSASLRQAGYEVIAAHDGAQAWARLAADRPDLVLLDIMLPGEDGLSLCRRLRGLGSTPVIMLTARNDDVDKIVGLELGADDYITKPFGKHEFLARVRAVLRRVQAFSEGETSERVAVGPVEVSLAEHRVWVGGREVQLTHTEFDLLVYLMQHAGRAVTREVLLDKVWGIKAAIDTRTVDNHVARLRKKLDGPVDGHRVIETVAAVGYRFHGEVPVVGADQH